MKSSTLNCWVDLISSSAFCGAIGLLLYTKRHNMTAINSVSSHWQGTKRSPCYSLLTFPGSTSVKSRPSDLISACLGPLLLRKGLSVFFNITPQLTSRGIVFPPATAFSPKTTWGNVSLGSQWIDPSTLNSTCAIFSHSGGKSELLRTVFPLRLSKALFLLNNLFLLAPVKALVYPHTLRERRKEGPDNCGFWIVHAIPSQKNQKWRPCYHKTQLF